MKVIGIILLVIAFIACGQEEASKAVEKEMGQSMGMDSPHGKMQLNYAAAEGWVKENPSSSMRVAQYKLPGEEGKDAEMAVFVFPGTGGSSRMNIDRWIGQFKQGDGSTSGEKATISDQTVNDLKVTTVYITGTYLQSSSMMMGGETTEMPNYAMLAAIVETSSDPWFFKATGPQETIDAQREAFDGFVKTFKE